MHSVTLCLGLKPSQSCHMANYIVQEHQFLSFIRANCAHYIIYHSTYQYAF